MKKIITMLMLVAGTISFASAQSRDQRDMGYNDSKKTATHFDQQQGYGNGTYNSSAVQNKDDKYNDRYQAQQKDNWNNGGQGQWKDQGYNNKGRYDDQRERQAAYDRMNQQYDQRIDGYRNDRSLNSYERQRRINEAEKERQQKSSSFGKGLVIGGIAALLIGVLASN